MSKAGRPKVPKNKAFAPGISIRLTAEERKRIQGAIRLSGLSQSDFARKCLQYVLVNGIRIT